MIDVIFLNKDLEIEYRCKTIDYYWLSKVYEPGEFQIQILTDNDLDLDICRYVITNTKKEIGVIGRWEYDSEKHNTVLISGFFMEQELFEYVIYPTYSAVNKDIWSIGAEICGTYLDDIGHAVTPPAMPSSGVIKGEALSVTYQQTGDYVGTALYTLGSVYGYGVAVTRSEKGIRIDITNYHDRTGETEDEEVVLSVSFNSIKNYDVIHDITSYRNVAVVAGEGEGSARVFEIVDSSQNGERKRYLWVDARDLQQEAGESIESYRLRLRQRGLEKLAENVIIDNVEVEIQQEDAERIGVDFDIGDIVWVVINPHKLIYKMKIIEVEDTHNKGKRTVSLVFGNKIPTQWEKVRALYR
ncbi:MAG: hypothetical protein ACI4QO_03955 [Clostridia bacterium]